MKALRALAALLLLSTAVYATEVAELRNGFTIRHTSREPHGDQLRLYLDASKSSFVDVAASDVLSIASEPDPEPSAATLPAPPRSTGVIVSEASDRHGVDPDFLHSVIRQESGGNPQAVSRAGARGLMQLMPATANTLGVHDSFNPEENVQGGARYLRELLERYNGDAVKALAAYNAGPAAVDRFGGVPPYRETRQYVRRVVTDYNRAKRRPATQAKTNHRTTAAPPAISSSGK